MDTVGQGDPSRDGTSLEKSAERGFKVYIAELSASELQVLIARFRVGAPFAILERPDKVDFFGPSDTIEVTDCLVGRVFGKHVELYWEQASPTYRVRLTQVDGSPPPVGFSEVLVLEEPEPEPVWYYLWGENETAIGGRLNYSQAISDQGRGQLGVVECRDKAGRLTFYRYVGLKREADNG